jgi:hypothetical protein
LSTGAAKISFGFGTGKFSHIPGLIVGRLRLENKRMVDFPRFGLLCFLVGERL